MRVIANSLMAALVVVALFWGNCLSCPQFLAALSSHQPAHGCCPRHHQPGAKTDCQSQALQQFVQAEKAPAHVPAVAAIAPAEFGLQLFQLSVDWTSGPAATPPDLISLNSTFRI